MQDSDSGMARRKFLAAAASGSISAAAGCLGGSPEGVESDSGSNEKYAEIAEENDLTESGREIIQQYCEELTSAEAEEVDSRLKYLVEHPMSDENVLPEAEFKQEGSDYVMVLNHGPPGESQEIILNGKEDDITEDIWPDYFAEEWLEAYEEDQSQIPRLGELVVSDSTCER